jgi:hypothetical protein
MNRTAWLAGCIGVAGLGLLASCGPKPTYDTTLPVSEVMAHIVDPAAWQVWHSSGTVDTLDGPKSLAPTTDEGWLSAESGSAAIAEAGNLLQLPGRARDDGDWLKYARALTAAGLASKAAAEAKDPQKMYVTGAQIYQVCTDCHAKYYLPYVPKDASWPAHPRLPEITPEILAKMRADAAAPPPKS